MTLTSLLKDQLKIIALPFLCFPFRTFFFLEPGNTVLTQKDHKTEKKIQILNVLSRSLNLLKKGKKVKSRCLSRLSLFALLDFKHIVT